MKFCKTKINGLFMIELQENNDERGSFTRIFDVDELKDADIMFDIVQINKSVTRKKGTIRGMHFQNEPKAEGKIIQCEKGTVFDVVIDLRPESATFGQHFTLNLTDENKKMLFVPPGLAHGFQTLEDNCEVLYLMSEFYSPKYSAGVRWDDPFFSIEWPLKPTSISEKDQNWPLFK